MSGACLCYWKGPKRVYVCRVCQPLVIIESPFAGSEHWTREQNVEYAQRAMLDSLQRREAPFASHLIYPQVLDDNKHQDRKIGIDAGLAWGRFADRTAVYCDHGISDGMRQGIERAKAESRVIVFRALECSGCTTPKPWLQDDDATSEGWVFLDEVRPGVPGWRCPRCQVRLG